MENGHFFDFLAQTA